MDLEVERYCEFRSLPGYHIKGRRRKSWAFTVIPIRSDVMKVQQKLVSCFFPLITVIALTINALASCPMIQQGPPCQEYWQAEAVFIGVANRVVHTPNKPPPDNFYVRTTVYITIEEVFRGIQEAAMVLNLDNCGHPFKEGERYLVYAHRNPNNKQLDVRRGFTRTRPVSDAAEDLNYIRGLSSANSGARVFGKVARFSFNYKDDGHTVEALPNIKVTLAGNNQSLEVVTDSEGRYEFKGVAAGTYRIRAEMPDYLSFDEGPIHLQGRECRPIDISARHKGVIVGRVFDVNRKPLVEVPVSVVSADERLEDIVAEGKGRAVGVLSFSDRDGRFRFTELPPGRYLLIINHSESNKSSGSPVSRALPRLFYPGTTDLGGATVITVGKDYEPREYDFHLPVQ